MKRYFSPWSSPPARWSTPAPRLPCDCRGNQHLRALSDPPDSSRGRKQHRPSLLAGATWCLLTTLAALGAEAQIAVGATAGTLGAGVEVSAGSRRLQARAALAAGSLSEDLTTSDVRYSGDLELQNVPLLLDFFPTGGAFRFTAGAVLGDNRIDATAPLSQLIDPADIPAGIPPSLIDSLGSLEGRASFDSFAPYLGIGFGNPLGELRRWHLKLDLGVVFTGEPDVELDARLNLPIAVPAELQLVLDALVAAEEAELEREVEEYDLYPVIQIGLSYRF